MAESPFVHLLSSNIELADRTRDRAIEPDRHDERDKFQNAEEDGYDDQEVLNNASYLKRGNKQPLVEQRGPRLHLDQRLVRLPRAPDDGLQRSYKLHGNVKEMRARRQLPARDGLRMILHACYAAPIDVDIERPFVGCGAGSMHPDSCGWRSGRRPM